MKPSAPSEDTPSSLTGQDLEKSPPTQTTERYAFLEKSAIEIGQTWAEGWRRDLHREGRRAVGGWPGTLREARTRVERALLSEMRCRKMPAITGTEREQAARTTYASARSEWRKHLDPEMP